MARYEHLPIYKAALDLTVHFEKVVAGFSRYHKYTLGTELREASRGVLMQVLRANNAATREQRAAELLVLRVRSGCRTKEWVAVWRYGPVGSGSPGRARQPEHLEQHGLPNRLVRA